MYKIRKTKRFEKSYIKLKRAGKISKSTQADLDFAVDSLRNKSPLPRKFKDHSLRGIFREYRECHIKGDLLLVYELIDDELVLVLINIGSHSQLFG